MKKYVAQVESWNFAKLLAERFNGWVEEKIINNKKLFLVAFIESK